MKFSNIYLSALLALAMAAIGCSDAEEPPGPGPQPRICPPARAFCTGDTVCGDTGCEPAFDRDYKVHLSLYMAGQGFNRCRVDRDCVLPVVAVYYSELSSPIIETRDEQQTTEIHVIEGSSLIVDFGHSDCAVDLSADRLRGGYATCSGNGVTASLSFAAQPM